MTFMWKSILLILIGLLPSYIFTSMLLNQEIVSPAVPLHGTYLEVSAQEIMNTSEGISFEPEGARFQGDSSYFEITDLQSRVKHVDTLLLDVEIFSTHPEEAPPTYSVFYAYKDEAFSSSFVLRYPLVSGKNTLKIPPYLAGQIDSLRVAPSNYANTLLGLRTVAVNPTARFSWPTFALVYLIYLLVILNGAWASRRLTTKKQASAPV